MNLVEILIRVKDETPGALAAAASRSRAFASAVDEDTSKVSRAFEDAHKAEQDLAKGTEDLASKKTPLSDMFKAVRSGAADLGKSLDQASANIKPGMVTPMQGLIAAGVVLSPVITTLAFGLGGLALAGYGVIKPIEKAAQATGGLQKNMSSLDPEQQAVARSLLTLQHNYAGFQNALKPAVLTDVNAGLRTAQIVMHGVEPVAAATGKALGGLLTSVGNEFRSGTWKQFFGFMAQTAAPDMQKLGTTFITLLDAVPKLMQGLQPLANVVLDDTNKIAGLTNELASLIQKTQQLGSQGGPHSSASPIKFLWDQAKGAAGSLVHQFFPATVLAYQGINKLAQKGERTAQVTGSLSSAAGRATANMQAEAAAAKAVTEKFITGLSPLNNYVNSTITAANDLHALKDALHKSGDQIGYHTQKQRDSFSAAQTYIQDLQQTANNALQSGVNVQGAANRIHNTIGVLEQVKGKTAAYRAELSRLVGLYQQLQNMANIVKSVTIVTRGSTSYSPNNPLLSGKPLAHGGITGAASGGVRSSLTMVGEHGPELVKLPAGSTVHSNPDTERMLSQGGSKAARLVIEMRGGGDAFSRFMLQWLRDHSRIEGGGDVQVAFGWSS